MTWSVNHFVPLMSSPAYDDSDNISHQSVSKVVNNASTQIRIPEFQSSPSRRLRSEHNNETGFAQSAATDAMRETQNSIHEQRQSTIEQQIKPNQENLVNEPAEHRRIRLEKQKQRDQSNRSNETYEKRKIRLENQNQRTKSNRLNETSEERQIRLTKVKERAQSSRMNETEEQRQIRLEKQRKRYQANRAKKLVEKSAANKLNTQQQNSSAHYVIKLYSPFHSTTTAQAALKGNCITFLQNLPNIVNSLPLKLDDLCDTLTVIFVGAHPPERVHLKKVLTARKKKVTQAMHWLKNNNILYQNVEINIHNINQLPDDDVPEAIMLTMEQKIDDEEIPSERVGYIPDLLADPTESTNSDTIPISNSFIFVVFNLLQRRDACFHAQLIATNPYFQASAQEIQSLNSNDIEMALNKSAKNTFNSTSNASIHKLLNHIKTIGGRVMGSTYSRTALRTRIHALIYNQGLPSIFLTLNPADIHSPVALYFAGAKLDLDNIQIEQLMTTYKRAQIIASHPLATAKFFHTLITNILDTMIVGGVLGPIKAYFGTVENQGRGSLHLHLLIWLDHDFKPSDLKEKIQNVDFREKLKAYLEDIIKEDLDEFKGKRTFENPDSIKRMCLTPSRLSRDSIYAALKAIDLSRLEQDTPNFDHIRTTPLKQHSSSSISFATPSPKRYSETTLHAQPNNGMYRVIIKNKQSIDLVFLTTNASRNESKVIPACLPTPNPSSPNFA
ncbi:unnamed protein product [Rotaria sp. Silwood2]|nr:unnamed protein product [Rotaria sp. Silwood2]